MRGTQRPADAQARRPKPHGRNSVVVSDGTFADGINHLLESEGFRTFPSRPAPLRALPRRAVS